MAKSKLEQVLEYLVNGNEDRAKQLLHQVFIEKARAIHENLISDDEMDEDDVLGGDEGENLRHDLMRHDGHIDDLSDEIDAEEIMGEGEGDDEFDAELGMDADMDMDDADMDMDDAEMDMDDADMDMADADMDMDDMGGDTMGNIENTMGDLESALEQLKAEFEKLESEAGGSSDFDDEDLGSEEDIGDEADFGDEEADDEEAVDDEEEELDEMFTDEDFDDLAEAIELEKVSVPTSGEVGVGKYSPRDANERSKSPLPASQTQRFGAAPIKTGKGPTASGYERPAQLPSQKTKILPKDNRRKTDTQDTEKEQKGNYGAKEDSRSALDTTDRTFGKGNSTSPLSRAPRK
jgi:hypothetical protein